MLVCLRGDGSPGTCVLGRDIVHDATQAGTECKVFIRPAQGYTIYVEGCVLPKLL